MKNQWNRKFWGVILLTPDDDPILIGEGWNPENKSGYPGEPLRCLLFKNRNSARKFCRDRNSYYSSRENHLNTWRMRPVRVVEKVSIVED